MSRYVISPKAKATRSTWWEDDLVRYVPTVDEHEAVDTGLLDASGHSIYRLPDQIGFVWKDNLS